MTKNYWQFGVGIVVLLTLVSVLGCTADYTSATPTTAGAETPATSADDKVAAAQKTIAAALHTTLTPEATATVTPMPTATPTWTALPPPDLGATATAKARDLATAVAATLTAAPTNMPIPTATPNLPATNTAIADSMATAVAETLTAQPPPTPNAIETKNAIQHAIELTLTAQPTPVPPPTAPPVPQQGAGGGGASEPLWIVFAYGDVGKSDLRMLDVASGGVRTLAGQTCDEAEPSWAPDEQTIAYHANCTDSYDIYLVNSANGATTRLTTTSDLDEREPDYAPDGSQLVYRVNPHDETKTNDVGELWMMDTNGNPLGSLGVIGRAPAWSPDGGRIVYMANPTGVWNIYVYDLGAQRATQVTHCATNCRWPAWSPNGQQIIYNTTTKANNTIADAIWVIDADGNNQTRLTFSGNSGRASWSRTGLIAFNSTSGLEVMQADGGGRRVLLANNDNWAPYWSR